MRFAESAHDLHPSKKSTAHIFPRFRFPSLRFPKFPSSKFTFPSFRAFGVSRFQVIQFPRFRFSKLPNSRIQVSMFPSFRCPSPPSLQVSVFRTFRFLSVQVSKFPSSPSSLSSWTATLQARRRVSGCHDDALHHHRHYHQHRENRRVRRVDFLGKGRLDL